MDSVIVSPYPKYFREKVAEYDAVSWDILVCVYLRMCWKISLGLLAVRDSSEYEANNTQP
jgi:hypothetical protein